MRSVRTALAVCLLVPVTFIGWGTTPGEVAASSAGNPAGLARALAASVDSASGHTCAIENGDVYCWGGNSAPHMPVELPGDRTAVSVVVGGGHTCALLDNGHITCWGADSHGQLGNGPGGGSVASPSAPVDLPPGRSATALTAGGAHTCALLDDGTLSCWGYDWSGQLGNGPVGDLDEPSDPIEPALGRSAVAVTAGSGHTCALLDDGDISCWGGDSLGQLGNGQPAHKTDRPGVLVELPEGRYAVAVDAHGSASCAVLDNGDLTCWGRDHGSPNAVSPGAPKELPGGRRAVATSSGCALLDDGDVACRRYVDGYAAGYDLIDLPPGRTATAIAGAGPCVVLDNGDLYCGGEVVVVETRADPSGNQVVATGAKHTCAIALPGDVACWGADDRGQLGNGPTTGDITTPPDPITLPPGRTATTITAGDQHTCALLDNGHIACWGADDRGQLGNGPTTGDITTPPDPITLPPGRTATTITAGDQHTCALLDNGHITCWGADDRGQLGNGPTTGDITTPPDPITLPPGRTATTITAGDQHTCALLDNGHITCWGNDLAGQLGNGPTTGDITTPPDPITLPPGRTATTITAGDQHTCALLDNGHITCWGNDLAGQLGNGPTTGDITTPPDPITLPPGRTATDVDAGTGHTCAVLDDATISCWGSDSDGQIGNGRTTTHDIVSPGPRAGGSVSAVFAGFARTCSLRESGQISCWGANDRGQLGQGPDLGDVTRDPGPVLLRRVPPLLSLAGITGTPGIPTDVRVERSPTSAMVSWAAPADDGGTPLLGYRVESSADGGWSWTASIDDTGSTATSATVDGLTDTQELRFRVRALSAVGASPPSLPEPPGPPRGWATVEPARLLDTRPGEVTIDGQHQGAGPIAAGTSVEVQIAGRGGVPADASAAVLNVTATQPRDVGFVTVYPCTADVPTASNLNYARGQTVANAALAQLSPEGTVCAFSRADTHLVIDTNGYVSPGSAVVPTAPARYLDTRPGALTIDGKLAGTGPAVGGRVVAVQITGRGGIPASATAAVLNVTVTEPRAHGFATVYPCTSDVPTASNLNYGPGQTVPNMVVAQLGDKGRVCIFNLAATHLIIDVNGHVVPGSSVGTIEPARLLETRPGETTVDGVHQGHGVVPAGSRLEVQIAGRGGIAAGADSAILNLTVTEPQAHGFVTAYPCTSDVPTTSNLNYGPGQTVANAAITRLSADGTVCIFNLAATHLIIDASGSG